MNKDLRVLLINPYFTAEQSEFIQVLSEPLGLISLATYVEQESQGKFAVAILDLYALGYDQVQLHANGRQTTGLSDAREIRRRIADWRPDVVGIHCNFTGYAEDAFQIAGLVKQADPQIKLILGGAHASYAWQKILNEHGEIDFIVCGEGEVTFFELLNNLSAGHNPAEVRGIACRDGAGGILSTPARELIADIDRLPVPQRKFIDMPTYLKLNKMSFPLARKNPVATVMASRGCPYNCIFCSTKNMWGRRWRGRSPENIVREIEGLVREYGVKEVAFYDDQFVVRKEWVAEICERVIERRFGIALSLPAGTSVWTADEPLLRKMKRAGFYRLTLPIESGNPETLKFIRKPVKLEKVTDTIHSALRLGFWTAANFIIGFPYETRDEIMRTIRFAYDCDIDYPFFFIARPFPGAEMYDIYQKEGLLKDEAGTSSSVFIAKCDTLHLSAQELMQIRDRAEKGFLPHKFFWCLNPRNFFGYVLPRFSSLEDIQYALKIIQALFLGKHKRLSKGKRETESPDACTTNETY